MGSKYLDIDSVWFENGADIEQQFYGPMDMKWFLDKLYGNAPPGCLAIHTNDIQNSFLFDNENSARTVLKAVELAKIMDIFFCIGLFDYHVSAIDYRDPQNITVIPGLCVNINFECSINTEIQLPTQLEAYKFLKSRYMKPNFIVDAGAELQAYWIFEDPFIINCNDDRDEIMKLSHDLQHKIITDAQRHGWQINETSAIANLQRLPGTWNHTFNPPKPIKLLEYAHI
ncbi:MAG: hypothetical protein WA096_01440 [Smithella sp.]|jgi:hypothetical protein